MWKSIKTSPYSITELKLENQANDQVQRMLEVCQKKKIQPPKNLSHTSWAAKLLCVWASRATLKHVHVLHELPKCDRRPLIYHFSEGTAPF